MLSRKGRIYDGMLCSSTTARPAGKSPCAAMPSHSQTLKTKVGNALAQSTMRTAAGHAFKTERDACEKSRCCIPTCSAAALLPIVNAGLAVSACDGHAISLESTLPMVQIHCVLWVNWSREVRSCWGRLQWVLNQGTVVFITPPPAEH